VWSTRIDRIVPIWILTCHAGYLPVCIPRIFLPDWASGPTATDLCKRIHTQNQETTTRWRHQERVFRALLSLRNGKHRRARSNNLPRRNVTATCARAMGQDYPLTGPSPGANPPTYPSSLPRSLGKLFGNIPAPGFQDRCSLSHTV